MICFISFSLALTSNVVDLAPAGKFDIFEIHAVTIFRSQFDIPQWRSQNAEKVTHSKGRLLYQALIFSNYVPFRVGTSLKGKNLLPEGGNSFF